MSEFEELRSLIEAAYQDRTQLDRPDVKNAVGEVIDLLDQGKIRVAEKRNGEWMVNTWTRQGILLYFAIRGLEPMESGVLTYYDKIPVKRDFALSGVRVVPPGVARYGSFIEPGAILMPAYVNIGAYVGSGSMVDTWATVGSCAQIGRDVHLAGGVGIGGVLEPPSATPVIVEDGVFVGSRCIIVEGVVVETEAVLGANVVLTRSTPIVDVTGDTPVTTRGRIPARSVVIPGTMNKTFPAGTFGVPCALIIGQRTESTNRKTSLNETLRIFGVSA